MNTNSYVSESTPIAKSNNGILHRSNRVRRTVQRLGMINPFLGKPKRNRSNGKLAVRYSKVPGIVIQAILTQKNQPSTTPVTPTITYRVYRSYMTTKEFVYDTRSYESETSENNIPQ